MTHLRNIVDLHRARQHECLRNYTSRFRTDPIPVAPRLRRFKGAAPFAVGHQLKDDLISLQNRAIRVKIRQCYTRSTTMPEHILIGPGKFGLGFAGDLFCRLGKLDTLLVSRASRDDSSNTDSVIRDSRLNNDKKYYIRFSADATTDEPKVVDSLEFLTTDYNEPSTSFIDAFSDSCLKLVTIAVDDSAFKYVAALLFKGFRARFTKGYTVHPTVLTLANAESNGKKIHALIASHANLQDKEFFDLIVALDAHFPICVVDRICSDIRYDIPPTTGLCVCAEEFASLIVEKSCENSELLLELGSIWAATYNRDVLKLVNNIEAWETLKYWGLNGLHMLLASMSRTPLYDQPRPAEGGVLLADVLKIPRLNNLVYDYIAEISAAIRLKYPGAVSREEATAFLYSVVDRVKQVSDTDMRILHSLNLDHASLAREVSKASIKVDENMVQNIIGLALEKAVGNALKKIDTRVLSPTFSLIDSERLIPRNLTLASSCILYAMAREARSV